MLKLFYNFNSSILAQKDPIMTQYFSLSVCINSNPPEKHCVITAVLFTNNPNCS